MADASQDLLQLLHETKAVSVWNHKTGPVFWYAASVPGPFYVNTELVIGPALAAKLLEKITAIIATIEEPLLRAVELNQLILGAYEKSETYRRVIAAMAKKLGDEFPQGDFDLISGGERRDWLFSIPLAREIGIKHAFLFKDGDLYCEQGVKKGERALHVADLINNAASYFDKWFPILDAAQIACMGTLCVNSRGTVGVDRLAKHGCKTVALNAIDIGFFEKSSASGLVAPDVVSEIAVYFKSPQDWASKYLTHDVKLFDVPKIDGKSFERLVTFFAEDPWQLKAGHEDFFAAMQKEIAQRMNV